MNLATHIMINWISGEAADSRWRALMFTVLQPDLSSLEIAARVIRLVDDNHFRGCPVDIGIKLRNPDRIEWDQVCRAVRP